MKLLGLDFETTGLDVRTDRIIEIGAVLWDTDLGVPLRIMSMLVHDGQAPAISAEIEGITGITQAMLVEHGRRPVEAACELYHLMHAAEAVVAHNGTTFDRPMFEAFCRRMENETCTPGIGGERFGWPALPWIDTCVDVPYPERMTTRKLVHLAAEHDFLNPFAHRAVFDVLTMLTVLRRYDVGEVMVSARQPSVTVIALVSFADNQLAKDRGYRWDAPTKTWRKVMKAHKVEGEQVACGFMTRVLRDEVLPM